MPLPAARRPRSRRIFGAVLASATAFAVLVPLSAADAAPSADCSTAKKLTTMQTGGLIKGSKAASGFVDEAYDSATGTAYIPHFQADQNVITSYQPATKTVVTCAFDASSDLNDSHDGTYLHVDADGYLHVVTGRHMKPPLYERSALPHDPTFSGGMVQPPSLVDDELPLPGATYPQLFSNPTDANQLIVIARRRTSRGSAAIEETTSSDHGDTWTPAVNIVDFTATFNEAKIYPEVSMGPDGRIHLVFTPHRWVVPGHCDPHGNTVIFYATSADFGQTWTKADGTPLTLPITEATADRVASAPTPQDRVQAKLGSTTAFDANGNPIVFFRQWTDAGCDRADSNPALLEEARWDGTEWTPPVAINPAVAHTGYAVTQLEPNSNVIEVYATRLYHKVPLLVVYRSADYGVTWTPATKLTPAGAASLVVMQSHNQTQNNEDLISYASAGSAYLLDRTHKGHG